VIPRRSCRSRRVPVPPPLWVWSQHWLDAAFLHWRAPCDAVQSLLPAPLEAATCEGAAWLSLVAFRLRVRPRGLPFVPGLSDLLEINLRTYVHCGGAPGIWFLSAHADNALAMGIARLLTPMPYLRAAMSYRREGDCFQFRARRASEEIEFSFLCRPDAHFRSAAPDSRDAWLLERYRLYARRPRGTLTFADVTHPPWRVQAIEPEQTINTLGDPWGLDLARPPDLAHYSPGVQARFGAFHKLKARELVGASAVGPPE
jgi:uncharacterized protein